MTDVHESFDDGSGPEPVSTQRQVQRVPVAVSVFTAQQAARDDPPSLQDVLQKIPTAEFRTQTSNKDRTVFIRGVGTISNSPGVEPSVSTVVDGVVPARSGQATLDLIGLDHVEVLRGPKGTLFGKNASAGAVNIVTAQPTDRFRGHADASYFTGDEFCLEVGVSGTLVPHRLTGVFTVLASGWDGNVRDNVGDKTVNDTVPNGVFQSTSHIAYPTNVVTPNPGLSRALAQPGVQAGRDNTTIDQQLGAGYTFTSITAWRRWHNTQYQDYDQLSVPSTA